MTKLFQIALLAAATALSLSACSSEPEDTAADMPAAAETDAVTEEPQPDAAYEDVTAEGIPDAMLGVWDYVEGNCNPASDLRLEIAPGQLVFYESVGEVLSVARDGVDVTITMAMEGEGENWEDSLTYRLADGGTILESDTRAPLGDGPLRRKRCEG